MIKGFRLGVICVGVLLVSACSYFGKNGTDVAKSVAPFAYKVGDSYTLDNPQATYKVSQVTGTQFKLSTNNQGWEIYEGHPVFPALQWNYGVHGQGKRIYTHRFNTLFPLKVGKKVSFMVNSIEQGYPNILKRQWTCHILKAEPIEVAQEKIMSWPITCVANKRDKITLFYAPKIGFYTKEIFEFSGHPPVVRHLIGFNVKR